MKIPLERFKVWLTEKNLKATTTERYCYYFLRFQKYNKFNNETVAKFLSEKTNQNNVSRSLILNLKTFLTKNYKEFKISLEDFEDIIDVELPLITGHKKTRLVKPLTYEEVYSLEKYFKREKDKLMLLITFNCGLRLGELLKIRVLSFNWSQWKKNTSGMGECTVFGKGDKEGIALVPAELMKRTARYIRSDKNLVSPESLLFIPSIGNEAYLPNKALAWREKLKKAGIAAGITQKDSEGKAIKETVVNPHRLRHSYAAYLRKEKNLDIMDIKELLRHSSIVSTQIYQNIDKEELKEKLS